MGCDRIEHLTPRQLACLRKVAEHKDSETIGFELGIAKNTVDVHVAAVIRKLGVSSRREAAQMFQAFAQGANHSVTNDIVGISALASFAPRSSDNTAEARLCDSVGLRASAFDHSDGQAQASPPPIKETKHALTRLERLALMAAIAAGISIVSAAALPISDGFQRLANAIEPYRQVQR